jgi:hypothetical protein
MKPLPSLSMQRCNDFDALRPMLERRSLQR